MQNTHLEDNFPAPSLRIVMNGTHRGSGNGFTTKQYVEGRVYDTRLEGEHGIGYSLACQFLQQGKAHKQTMEEWQERLTSRATPANKMVASILNAMQGE